VVRGLRVQREQNFPSDGIGGGKHMHTIGAAAGTVKAESRLRRVLR
jgi:hypothetical protein